MAKFKARYQTPQEIEAEIEKQKFVLQCPPSKSTHYLVRNGKPIFYKAIEKKKGDK